MGTHAFWSNIAPSLGCGIDIRVKEIDYPKLRQLLDGWRRFNPNYFGDFYPLSPWIRDAKVWIAWQFDRPEAGTGAIQVFRRSDSFYEAARFKLQGLNPDARYSITYLDSTALIESTGRQLMDEGLLVTLKEQPQAAVFLYERVK
jgi:hypothetical protein